MIAATIHKDDPQFGRDKRRVQIKFVDHLSNVTYSIPRLVATDFVVDLSAEKLAKESSQASEEFNLAVENNDVSVFSSPKYQSQNDLVKQFVFYYQDLKDPIKAIELKPIADWISANYNGAQLRTATGITVSQSNDYNSKVGDIIGIASIVDSFLAYEGFE